MSQRTLRRYLLLRPARTLQYGVLFAVMLVDVSARAQSGQFLPELDVYYKAQPNLRLWFQAKETREGGGPVQAEFGPSLEFYMKPWLKLTGATIFNTDESTSRPLVLSVGYRYMPSPDKPAENRLEVVGTGNVPLKGKILLADRNRFDLDWQNGDLSWQYRNRVTLSRAVHIHAYHPTPYMSAEFFYQSEYGKWSDTALYAGCSFPISRHAALDPYYEHQNNTGTGPNQQLNQLGLILNLFF